MKNNKIYVVYYALFKQAITIHEHFKRTIPDKKSINPVNGEKWSFFILSLVTNFA